MHLQQLAAVGSMLEADPAPAVALTTAQHKPTIADRMPRADRLPKLKALQDLRGTFVITYVTSTRQGLDAAMGDDAVRMLYDHLMSKPTGSRAVDLFIHSNGGQGTVPWRIVNLIREFADKFEVLIPYKAYSAATLTALGADKIIMHQMGELGPIDPSVANAFNPRDQANNNQPMPISVEDVLSYIALVKEDVGIRHEDELVHSLLAFMNNNVHPVHPLALGNVKRHHARSKLVARKLLLKHMQDDDEVKIDRIVDNLTSKLFYHGHPISRHEAKHDLDLKVDLNADQKVLDAMWSLYEAYEEDLQLRRPFDANSEFERARAAGATPTTPPPAAPTPMAMPGPMGGVQMVMQPAAPASVITLTKLRAAVIESEHMAHVFETDLRLRKFAIGPAQEGVSVEVLRREWVREA